MSLAGACESPASVWTLDSWTFWTPWTLDVLDSWTLPQRPASKTSRKSSVQSVHGVQPPGCPHILAAELSSITLNRCTFCGRKSG